ncbi:MAG: hypothetical protein JWO93_1219 [Micrococcaceae bacterium]|jgi:hypothetical protein|nr:hypothetical protein [Micrococcaceae bacterium]
MTSIAVGHIKRPQPQPVRLPDLSDPKVVQEIYDNAEKDAKTSRARRLGIFRGTKPVRG